MTTTPENPKMGAILLDVQKSYTELVQLIDGPLASLSPDQLYQTPVEGEWSIMQNLAHILEFAPYWANQIDKLVANPGQNFGRTIGHEGRLQGIRDHEQDSLEQIKQELPASFGPLEATLGTLRDTDLGLTATHSKFGEQSLEWFIEEFVTRHLRDHVVQMREDIAALGKRGI